MSTDEPSLVARQVDTIGGQPIYIERWSLDNYRVRVFRSKLEVPFPHVWIVETQNGQSSSLHLTVIRALTIVEGLQAFLADVEEG